MYLGILNTCLILFEYEFFQGPRMSNFKQTYCLFYAKGKANKTYIFLEKKQKIVQKLLNAKISTKEN